MPRALLQGITAEREDSVTTAWTESNKKRNTPILRVTN
jgi:hypothetical protein